MCKCIREEARGHLGVLYRAGRHDAGQHGHSHAHLEDGAVVRVRLQAALAQLRYRAES
jgi:hypothetical protein